MVFLNEVAAPSGVAGILGSPIFMFVIIIAIMYFLMIRPQQKKQKEIVKFRESLKKGDKIVTIGGIYGVVAEVKEQYIIMEIDNNVKIRVDKQCVVRDSTDIQVQN